jgi:hypothetical protein
MKEIIRITPFPRWEPSSTNTSRDTAQPRKEDLSALVAKLQPLKNDEPYMSALGAAWRLTRQAGGLDCGMLLGLSFAYGEARALGSIYPSWRKALELRARYPVGYGRK